MSCSNCYNGCTEIVSDKCVKYSGIDIPALEIKNGDSLSYVEQALIQFLVSTLDGSGIKIALPQNTYCDLVTKYLPTCGDVTALTLFEALVKAACDLQEQIDEINTTLDTLNADYDVDCLTGVTDSSDTHNVLQAVITKLCELDTDLTALAIDVDTNYVKLADLNSLIAAYLASQGGDSSTKYYTRMVPYTAVEFYPTPAIMANFGLTGIGSGDWEKIYLCNGLNNTPDKRGVVPVGATDGTMGGGAMNPAVQPGGFNPTYVVGGPIQGSNSVTLNQTQIPSHTHTNNFAISPNPHSHTVSNLNTATAGTGGGADPSQTLVQVASGGPFVTSSTSLSITGSIANTGDGLPHANNQPALACYYIMYLP